MGKRIIVISGFSGVGKGTMVRHLLELNRSMPMRAKLWLSVSDTTRSPRKDGGDNYNFISSEEYNNRIASGYYLEHNNTGIMDMEHQSNPFWQHLNMEIP